MKKKIENNDIDKLYRKAQIYAIAKEFISSDLILWPFGILILVAALCAPNLVADIFRDDGWEVYSLCTFVVAPLVTIFGGLVVSATTVTALHTFFEKKENEAMEELMKLSKQKEFDKVMPETKTKVEKEVKGYTNVKNDRIMARVNIFASVTNNRQLVKPELEEEWKIYLYDKISQGYSDESIKEIIFGLLLLNSDKPIETIYEKLSNSTIEMQDLIYFSPRGEELQNLVSELEDKKDANRNRLNLNH